MGKFLEEEKLRQTQFKVTSEYFTEAARNEGDYRGKLRRFCIPIEQAEENLFGEFRSSTLDYFKRYRIKWHDGQGGKPSNHLCSSQVQCVNFLYAFADKPQALVTLLRPIFPEIRMVIPMETEGHFVSFEWIGQKNYLGERIPRGGTRTRGANFTSADAAVMFRRQDGIQQILLIEWKYTESYGRSWLGIAKSGTSRMDIYRRLYEHSACPLDKKLLPEYADLFYEPFYQFFRQQLLANEMELAHELGADIVTVLHIAAARNPDFRQVTSKGLQHLGDSSIDIWKRLVKRPDRFVSVTTEDLFGRFAADLHPEVASCWRYVNQRYPWLQG